MGKKERTALARKLDRRTAAFAKWLSMILGPEPATPRKKKPSVPTAKHPKPTEKRRKTSASP